MTEVHDDPLREAASAVLTIGQELTAVVAATQALQLRLIGVKPDKDAPLPTLDDPVTGAQPDLRTKQAASRIDWQPALGDEWLSMASPVEAARAWAAALPYASLDPSANLALARTEARLAELHPAAMEHYRDLRAQGRDPAEAMMEAAPIFDTPSAPMLEHQELVHAHHAPQLTNDPLTLSNDLGMGRPELSGPEFGSPAAAKLDDPLSMSSPASPSLRKAPQAAERRKAGNLSGDGVEVDVPLNPGQPTIEGMGADDLTLNNPGSPDLGMSAPSLDEPQLGLGNRTPAPPGGEALQKSGPEGPMSEAARAAEIAGRTFPNAYEASQRLDAMQINTPKPPQKRKVLQKVLRRGRGPGGGGGD
jgi:hypothetical protein